jgi:hypothetical protein
MRLEMSVYAIAFGKVFFLAVIKTKHIVVPYFGCPQ